MRIHNYGNDYIQANKFKERETVNVENKTEVNRSRAAKPISTATEEASEAQEKTKTRFNKKNPNKTDNIQ